jgi:tetratricopeptide (TPR) repeat protein
MDPYAPCPCGSGKKFKWCCQPIGAQIEKAFQQDQEGQHEAALRLMDQLTTEHPANPEAWGRKAQLLYQNGQADDGEKALQKAFEINPKYPFGFLLRGLFRQQEGEIAGALLLFRKAAELYDPEARDVLTQVYSLIADSELKLNRPVAARAALQMCMRLRPSEEVRQGLDELFGPQSRLPEAAKRQYTFQSPPANVPSERRAAWDRALAGAGTGKLADAASAFAQLTAENEADAAALYNLGLVRSWLGDNSGALEALDRYVTLEPDEQRAADAWALAEVLRFGQGMEDQADYVDHSAVFQIRDPQRLFPFLQEWQRERRLTAVQVREEEGMVSGIVLDRTGLLTAGTVSNQPARLGAYLLMVNNLLILRNTNAEALDRARQELQQRAGQSLSAPHVQRGPANFADTLADALIFPIGAKDDADARKQVRDYVQRYFEETWIHRPLKSLNNVPPVDAAGHGVLRKKLRGVLQFVQQCASGGTEPYEFDRLRRKLGLLGEATVSSGTPAAAKVDIGAMSAAELANLVPEALTEDQMEQAYRAAQKLDARDLATRFAEALVERPPNAARPDRFPWYTFLVQQALAEGNTDSALNCVNQGEKADCEQNEGRRRNDYELRRGQILTKAGQTDSAREVFERLIERVPGEMHYRSTATESMLAAKQGAVALRFAEQGLAKAREKNDRDSEQHFMELMAAARRQVG